MCAIIGWAGPIPPNLLKQLYLEAAHRGQDSTGLAFRSATGQNLTIRQAVRPQVFVGKQESYLEQAQRAVLGLGHTRRASPKMPVDNHNAHPYIWESYVFAHNGVVRNWKTLRGQQLRHEWPDNADRRRKYLDGATTDSMVLGPCIEELNFSQVVGSMGLIWLEGDRLFCLRSAKELTSAVINWQLDDKVQLATVVASTWEIVEKALAGLKNVEYDANEVELAESTLYAVTPAGPVNEGAVLTNSHNEADSFSSRTEP